MFIGAGPAGPGGASRSPLCGAVLHHGDRAARRAAVNIFGKRLSRAVHRQAITVVLLAVAVVMAATLLMLLTDSLDKSVRGLRVRHGRPLDRDHAHLRPAQLVLMLLMFLGRLGPLTLGTAIALEKRLLLTNTPTKGPSLAKFDFFSDDPSRRIAEADSVAVIGLGRFGSSLALELMAGAPRCSASTPTRRSCKAERNSPRSCGPTRPAKKCCDSSRSTSSTASSSRSAATSEASHPHLLAAASHGIPVIWAKA